MVKKKVMLRRQKQKLFFLKDTPVVVWFCIRHDPANWNGGADRVRFVHQKLVPLVSKSKNISILKI